MNTDKPSLEFESAPIDSRIGNEIETNRSRPLTIWIATVIALIALADQLSKRWALTSLSDIPGNTVSVFGDFLRWTLVYNEGGAMGTNLGGSTLYAVIGVVILLALGYYLWQYRYSAKVALPLALIAGGAIGNLIDRFRLGRVVDWIDVNFFDISLFGFQLERWWTFNIADSAISVALVYMLWHSLFPASREPQALEVNVTGEENDVERGA